MRTPVLRRGRTGLLTTAALAAFVACIAAAQQPATDTAAQPAAAPAAKKAAAKPAAAKPAAAKNESASYSVGLSMGEQLRATGITADMIDPAQLAAGVHDAVTGKTLTDKDRDNIRALVTSVGESNHRAAAKFLAENGKKPDVVTTTSGLQYKIVSAGTGASPKSEDQVTVNYRGMLINGTEFDSSYKRGQPATFPVSGVIRGWTEALQLMKPGAKWQLFVPPQLAYDLQSRPPIPPGSLLIFDVELLSVKPAGEAAAAAPQPAKPAAEPPPK